MKTARMTCAKNMAAVKTLFGKCQVLKSNTAVLGNLDWLTGKDAKNKLNFIACDYRLDFCRQSSLIQQNGMAMYPSFYIDPVYRKEDQQELVKAGEIGKYSHIPTKAALNNQTCAQSHDPLITLFTNYAMRHGRKSLAREQVDKTLEQVKRLQLEKYHKCTSEEEKSKIELNPKLIFRSALENCKPILQLMGVKRGGVRYQVPVPISDHSSQFIAMNWLIEAGKEKDRKVRFAAQLARELVDAANNTGRVVRKKQELHRQCEANKAYAHYRWS